MADNFKIVRQQDKQSLHLRLEGDFDGHSAYELLGILGEKTGGYNEIVVHTDHLGNVFAFGRVIFQTNYLSTTARNGYVVFRGDKAGMIAPGGVPVRS